MGMDLPSADITIVRNAPPPQDCETRGRKPGNTTPHATRTLYPFDDLRVGDAFDVPITSGRWAPHDRFPEYNRLQAAVSGRHKRRPTEGRFKVRILEDYWVRCWRVA